MDQRLVIVRGEKESAAYAILEVPEHHVRQRHRKAQVFAPPAVLQQLEQGIGE